jgi:protein-tyrosine phosphatase
MTRYPKPVAGSTLFIGPQPDHPAKEEIYRFDEFRHVINVSDTPCWSLLGHKKQKHYWYPIVEMWPWPLGTLDAIIRTIDHCQHSHDKGPTYLHCHAGAMRSPAMAMLWCMTHGSTLEQAATRLDDAVETSALNVALRHEYLDQDTIDFLVAKSNGLCPDTFSTAGAWAAFKKGRAPWA